MKALLPLLLLLLLPALVWAQEPGLPSAEVVRQALQHPLMRDLQYWWLPLQGFTGGSVLFDQGPLRADMTLAGASGAQNGPQWANADRSGSYAHLTFDGTDDMATSSASDNPTPFAPYTVCAWAKATATMGSEQHVLDAGNGATTPYGQLSLAWTFGGNNLPVFFWYHDSVGIMGVVSTLDVGTGTWVHLCGVNDGSGSVAGMALYVNGAMMSTPTGGSLSTWTGSAVGSNPWRMGQTAFNGAISEGMVWYRALSAPEVQALYQASQAGYQPLAPALLAQPYEQPAVVVGGVALPWFRYALLGPQSRLAPGLEQDLVSWWRATPGLSEAAVWPDLMETANDGMLTGMGYDPTSGWGATDRPGGEAQLNFDGVNDYVDTTTPPNLSPTTPFTLCAWVETTVPSASVGSTWQPLAITADAGLFNGVNIHVGEFSLQPTMSICSTGCTTESKIQLQASLSLNTWTHLCALYDGSQTIGGMALALNGELGAVNILVNTGFGAFTVNPWRFGSMRTLVSSQLFQGSLDDIRIWQRALSARELQGVYQQSLRSLPAVESGAMALMGTTGPTPNSTGFFPFFHR